MPTSSSTAFWEGGLKKGKGHFDGKSGKISADYLFSTRFEGTPGTSPEELLASAHASCLSMALAAGLEGAGHPATRITTTASCTLEKVGDDFRITRMKLEVSGIVPGIEQATFAQAAEAAKNGCPVSNAFKGNMEIELNARLES
ncbi:MAG: OsmC family peroxiredoxin [Gemmatimonadota bacterium]